MDRTLIAGRTIEDWKKKHPLLVDIILTKETFWLNPKYEYFDQAITKMTLSEKDIEKADDRLNRFAPYIAKVFPETRTMNGIIESPVVDISHLHIKLESKFNQRIPGKLLLKCDNMLPIAGSIKARGGIHEVLLVAENLALENNLLTIKDDYSIIDSALFRQFYSNYCIVVGSTGNLGLSIGIMSAKLGFNVTVHMSADAKQWKKELLRSKGVSVVEHNTDYSEAVKIGRKDSDADSNSYFVDDENSTSLFLGYAVAASRLKKQLDLLNILVNQDHPLFVYLPCGVGGAPGGIAFGLKLLFKDNVHCFFVEPTHSPSMLLGLMTEMHDRISVQDFGIDNLTEADGLAVGRPSGFIGRLLENLISGIYTVEDSMLYMLLSTLMDSEGIPLEPSALAGIIGPVKLFNHPSGQQYLEDHNLMDQVGNATHIPWATGGSLVPADIIAAYYKKGTRYLSL